MAEGAHRSRGAFPKPKPQPVTEEWEKHRGQRLLLTEEVTFLSLFFFFFLVIVGRKLIRGSSNLGTCMLRDLKV